MVMGDDVPLQAYRKDNQSTPPQEMVDFFRDLEKVPRAQEASEERKDVCLGFS